MSFPETRNTLIRRIASGGSEGDWQEFLLDYWGPICRFALRHGRITPADAEDVAGNTFLTLLRKQLLGQWVMHRTAKLRTLLCTLVIHELANRDRMRQGRERLLRDYGGRLDGRGGLPLVTSPEASAQQVDAFYAAWVEDLLQQAVESLFQKFHRTGKGDPFRVLYGRLCEGMTLPEVAQALRLTISQAEYGYKQARQHLAAQVEGLVRDHVGRYCAAEEAEEEFAAEWGRLNAHIQEHGGLEEAVRRTYEVQYPVVGRQRKPAALNAALERMSGKLRSSSEVSPGGMPAPGGPGPAAAD